MDTVLTCFETKALRRGPSVPHANDERLRAAFITVLTLQGAMMFKDEVPLSHLLHDFCKERSDLLTLSN